MSYFSTEETGASEGNSDIVTARSHDIWVAQKLYGANWDTRDEDTTYGYFVTPDVEGTVYEFGYNSSGDGEHLTIWDAGGDDDWLDMSGDLNAMTIDLRPGAFSSVFGEVDNLSMALAPDEAIPGGTNILIENARGGVYNDIIMGNASHNTLEGLTGNDIIAGFDGNDALFGGYGDDTLSGGFGTDYLNGGAGTDTADFSHSDVDWEIVLIVDGPGSASNAWGTETLVDIEGIIGSHGDDLIEGSYEENWLCGNFGNDTIKGHTGDDTVQGDAGNDTLFGGTGDDELFGGTGVDTADYSYAHQVFEIDLLLGTATDTYSDNDTLTDIENARGGSNDDTIGGDYGDNSLYGSGGHDSINGRNGNDVLLGEEGFDWLLGGYGNDVISGGTGIDTASYAIGSYGVTVDLELQGIAQDTGGAGIDALISIEALEGSNHDDILAGDDISNALTGLDGDDTLLGREGDDALYGGEGDDILEGGLGDDFLFGGAGQDTASYQQSVVGVYVFLGADNGYNTVGAGTDAYYNVEDIIGSDHADSLYGDEVGNQIHGGDGNDVLDGDGGADGLYGGQGNDILIGGASNDVLDGGAGVDWVRFFLNSGVQVDLSKDQQWTNEGSDFIVNVENVRGWSGGDDLRGDDGNNHLMGLSGDDTLVGDGGEDILEGGSGNDLIYAGTGEPGGVGGLDPVFVGQSNAGGGRPGDAPGGLQAEAMGPMGAAQDIMQSVEPLQAAQSGGTGQLVGGGGGGGGGGGLGGGGLEIPGDYAQPDGSGPDTIVFTNNWGDDQVYGFTAGADSLDFSAVSGLSGLANMSINDTADGVLIEHGQNSVLLHDVTQADLQDSDFVF